MFVANDSMPNFLFHGTGGLAFHRDRRCAPAWPSRPTGGARAGMGTDAGDYDGDGQLDLVVTNLDLEMHSLYRSLGDRLFAYATPESGIGPATLPFVGFGVVFFDFDNDTQLDLALRQRPHHGQRAAVSRRGDLRAAQSAVPQPAAAGASSRSVAAPGRASRWRK